MILGKKEPAAVAGIITAVVALLVSYGVFDDTKARSWETLALILIPPIAQAVITRQSVFSPHTIEQAGLSPEAVQERASDPEVLPFRETPRYRPPRI
jgi:hypothetical protein